MRHKLVRVEARPGGGKRFHLGEPMAVNDRYVHAPTRAPAIWKEWAPADPPEYHLHRFARLASDNMALPRLVALARSLHRICVDEGTLVFECLGSRVTDIGIQLGRFQLTNGDRFDYVLPNGTVLPSETDPEHYAWLCARRD